MRHLFLLLLVLLSGTIRASSIRQLRAAHASDIASNTHNDVNVDGADKSADWISHHDAFPTFIEQDAKLETDVEADAEAQADAVTEAEAEADADAETEIETEAELDAETRALLEQDMAVDADADAHADVDIDMDMDMGMDMDMDMDADADVDADADLDMDMDLDIDHDLDRDLNNAVKAAKLLLGGKLKSIKKTVTGKACTKNHPTNNKPGVCITSTSCTAAGGVTAKGLCPGDFTIRCCGGNNVNVVIQTQSRKTPPSTAPKTLTTSATTSTTPKSIKQTVTGKACFANHPANKKPGVCIKSATCTAAGGVTAKGLCPGDSTILCCGGNNVNVIIQAQAPKTPPATIPAAAAPTTSAAVKQTVIGKACSKNHPSNNKPGVCIKSATCTAAGGVTAKGLCPGDATILCCGGNNVNVIIQAQAPMAPPPPPPPPAMAPPASTPISTTTPIPGTCSYANAPILQIAGNDGIYSVTKILRDHLTDSSAYDMAPNVRDNTMKIDVACRFDEMRSAAAATGVNIKISSGFRTIERQQYFYNCSAAGCCCCNNCNVAAIPGTSNHGFGIALDLNTNCGKQDNIDACRTSSPVYVWLAANAATYGFRRAVLSEPWHWEYRGTGTVATDYT